HLFPTSKLSIQAAKAAHRTDRESGAEVRARTALGEAQNAAGSGHHPGADITMEEGDVKRFKSPEDFAAIAPARSVDWSQGVGASSQGARLWWVEAEAQLPDGRGVFAVREFIWR